VKKLKENSIIMKWARFSRQKTAVKQLLVKWKKGIADGERESPRHLWVDENERTS
jgi:hypothetical protein